MSWTGWGGWESERGREMARRIWLLLDGRWDVYMCVLRGWNARAHTNTDTRTHTDTHAHTAGQLWPGSGQLPVATAGTGVSCQPVTDWYRHPPPLRPLTLPNLHLHSSIPPAPIPPSSSSSGASPCLVGMFERRRIGVGVEEGGSQPPSWLWPVLEHALLSPSLSHSVGFISVSHVSYKAVVLLSLHLASWQQPAGGPSVPVVLSNEDWMSYSPPAVWLSCGRCCWRILDYNRWPHFY